ncbi:hypothetical protein CROQUDRAFT_656073 [Cronartium quercuum f. sp. fusiforme G11]|uniref:Eukaryotic translation initiation factor 3 subunit H n=1 Tax=Cronartium quercuum f. sp. fusiforme G11 TaxID=708437 RepID=A0A9P6NKZ9_9BASI|nr:hypothetical protein CROQUDRAFT_656073 [Cronartium quercuum f. sp. fusiforme G11]
MAAKPLTAAAAIMVASNSRNNAPSPAPTPANKHFLGAASHLTELEHEVPVESVKVDSLAVMKIIKHARESAAAGSSSPAAGQLLGLDSAGVLNVSDAFSLPSGSLVGTTDGEENKGTKLASRYTSSILPRLSALGADANIVGFYCSTINGQHLATPGFIETLISIQLGSSNLGSKMINKPSNVKSKTLAGKGLAIVYDLASSTQGTVQLKAYRLSPNFVETYRSGKFDSQTLADHKLTVTNILQEIPLVIQSSALLTAFLATLLTPNSSTPLGTCLPSYAPLGLPSSTHSDSPAPISDTLLAVISAIETHNTALSTLSFQSRQLARDRTKLESVISKRKADNEIRAQQGLPPIPPSAEEAALQEPSRLETMCALSGVDGAAKKLSETSGLGIVRAFGAKAGI